MYQALYRTWRPQSFSDMVGQTAVVRTLRNQVVIGRIAHAYLFSGSRGTGKTSAAKIMARAINCENPISGDPCGKCSNCLMLAGDASLDVYEMDAASNSRVEEIRDLLEKVDYPPQFGKYKVYIIDEVHMLSNAAFNALLKTLEEPPAYMVFILATTEPQKIPATILSRCQRFDFGRLTEEQLMSRMQKALGGDVSADPGALALIARAAEGSMRDAWSLLDMCMGVGGNITEEQVMDALGTTDKQFHFDFLAAIATRDGTNALNMIDELMHAGRDVQIFLRDFSSHVRQVIASKLNAIKAAEITQENLMRFQKQAGDFSMERLLRILDLLMRAEADTRWAASARAVLEVFALRACGSTEVQDISVFAERVSELERELSSIKQEGLKFLSVKKVSSHSTPVPEQSVESISETQLNVSDKLPKDIWNTMLKHARTEEPSIFNMLGAGTYGGYSAGTYKINFNRETSFCADFLNDSNRKDMIARWLSQEAGSPVKFEALYEKKETADTIQKENDVVNQLIDVFGRDKVQIDGD